MTSARSVVCTLAAMILFAAIPAATRADTDIESGLSHCGELLAHAPASQKTALIGLNKALDGHDEDNGAQSRRIAAAAHRLIDAHPVVDDACRAVLTHIAALGAFYGGDPAAAARDERAALAFGIAREGSVADRAQIYVVFGAYLHAAGVMTDAIAAENQAVRIIGATHDRDDAKIRSQAWLAAAAFLSEAAQYGAAATTYERVADDELAEQRDRMFGALFGGWMRQAMGDEAAGARDFSRAQTFAPDTANGAMVLLYRGLSALAAGRYGDAETMGHEMQRGVTATTPNAALIAGFSNDLLGATYLAENRVADAAAAYDRARSALSAAGGDQAGGIYLSVLAAEAEMYVRIGRYADARDVLAGIIASAATINPQLTAFYGNANPVLAPLYSLDATAALALGDTRAATNDVTYQLAALRAMPQSAATAGALTGRAAIERVTGDLAAARRDIDRARAMAARLSSADRIPDLDLQSAVIAYYANDTAIAKRDFASALAALQQRFGGAFGVLGERDRLAFAQLEAPLDDAYLTFAVRDASKDASLAGAAYDIALFRKDLVAQTVTALAARVRQSHDPAVAQTFEQLVATRRRRATAANVAVPDASDSAATTLTRQSQDLERALLAHFPDLANSAAAGAHWQNVRAALHTGEAAVELLRYRRIANRRTDGEPAYAAVVVRTDSPQPALIDLGPAAAIEGNALLGYRQIGTDPSHRLIPADRHALEALVWRPIFPALHGAKTIYLAADGVLNTVSFALLTDDAGNALGENIDLRMLDSTKDLLAPHTAAPAAARTALLFGDPAFDLTVEQQRLALNGTTITPAPATVAVNATFSALRGVTDRAALAPLHGTRAEVQQIDALLRGHGYQTQPYLGAAALEETFERSAHGQSIVHLATHGAFLPDPNNARPELLIQHAPLSTPGSDPSDPTSVTPPLALPEVAIGTPQNDPMLRSLLFFAGADRSWTQRQPPPPDLQSGIFTAEDAASLDLHGTQLVVLSACETGLGAVQSGDGVLGLRRALREAGAQSILMSLWQLPDRETNELITAFYRHYLNNEEPHAALRKAEQEERAIVIARYKTDDPYYYAGFILSGTPDH